MAADKLKITNESRNLLFDETHPDCTMQLCQSQGDIFAFLTVLDVDVDKPIPKNPHTRQYWGKFSNNDTENSIREILHTGGKWPVLSYE